MSKKLSQSHESVSHSSFPISNSFLFEPFESNSLTTFLPSHSNSVICPCQFSLVSDPNPANESSSFSSPVNSCPSESQSQPQFPESCHPIITRTKSGNFKPKTFIVT